MFRSIGTIAFFYKEGYTIKQKILILVFSLLIIISLVGQISATFTPTSVINEFQNGIIDISVNEKHSNNQENSGNKSVLPYDEIKKNTSITNNGSDCYVRMMLDFSNKDIANDISIVGMGENWVFRDDGYYYYTKPFENKKTINLFDAIKLGDINECYQLSDFECDIKVDAVQSKNFIVDFNSNNPWGDVEILKHTKNETVTEYKQLPDETFKVIYQDDIKGMVKNFDSFFNHIEMLMPGDSHEETLIIENDSKYHQEVYFSTQNVLNKDFLEKVIFTIIDENDTTLFNGTLGDNEEILLTSLGAKANCEIKFKIEVSSDVDSEFALEKSSVKWIFSTQHIQVTPPQTGDNTHIELYMFLMAISAVGLLLTIRGMRKDGKNT